MVETKKTSVMGFNGLKHLLRLASSWKLLPVVFYIMYYLLLFIICAFSALTLLVGWQEEHPACKNLGGLWAPLVWLGWRPPGLAVLLPPLSSPLLHKNPEDRRWGNPA